MAEKARGIEVFGRGATVVSASGDRSRGPALGVFALMLALTCATLLGFAIHATAEHDDSALTLAIAAIAASIASILCGLAALVTGRGRRVAVLAILLALVANPWLLTRTLEYAQQFSAGFGGPV